MTTTAAGGIDFVERGVCPACTSTRLERIFGCNFAAPPIGPFVSRYYRRDADELARWEYRLELCGSCGLIFQRHVGDAAFLAELYDVWLNEDWDPDGNVQWQRILRRPLQSRDAHELLMAAHFLAKPLSALRTLDYGMGYGLWAQVATLIGCESYGHDISSSRMEYASRHGVRTLRRDALPGHSFDFINADQLFEHVPDPLVLATELAALLSPGGILKIAVPRGDDVRDRLKIADWDAPKYTRHSLTAIHPLEHINCYSRHALESLGRRVGLEPTAVPWRARFAFLEQRGSVPWLPPTELLRTWLRPWHRFHNPHNLYVWLRRASS